MMNHDAYSDYHAVNLDAQTSRATPVELVLLLTDGLLEELARAREHIVGKRYEQKAISLNKCTEINNGVYVAGQRLNVGCRKVIIIHHGLPPMRSQLHYPNGVGVYL